MRHRFGRRLKLPSTRAIKHQILMLELEDEISAASPGNPFDQNESVALAQLRQLNTNAGPERTAHWREG
jgi:hypothetical protein